MNIDQIVNQADPELIALRRHFHEYPELSQQEFNTLDFIKQKLESWGISCTQVPKGGIFGVLDSGKPGITVLMRADVDALPVEENKENLSTARCCISRNKGVMHACGHDGWKQFMRDIPAVSSAKRSPFIFTAKNGISHMEPGPASKSCSILVWAIGSIWQPAHTAILMPSPVLLFCLRPK